MKLRLWVLLLCVQPMATSAQVVIGTVTSGEEPVGLATVQIVGTALGTAADLGGAYRLELPGPGRYFLRVSAIGFEAAEHTLNVDVATRIRVDVDLIPAIYEAGAVVVTGTMIQEGLRVSPVRVHVVPSRFLETVPTVNVMEALARVNGLSEQIDCSICHTSSIRINGVDGANTAVLIDGMPLMSSLAAQYGLQGISPILVHQVEIIHGPVSTLYGSEALGGVINILTKNPAATPSLSVNAYGSSRGAVAAEFSAAPFRGRTGLVASGTVLSARTWRDANADGFSDGPLINRTGMFAKLVRQDERGFPKTSLAAKVYYENRTAGTRTFFRSARALRGSGVHYGESILTRRAELFGTWIAYPALKLSASGALHAQDSFYGPTAYAATQSDAFAQLVWTPRASRMQRHNPLAGLALRLQHYDDGTDATGTYDEDGQLTSNRPHVRFIPGLFVQEDWQARPDWRVLAGLRADHQKNYGLILSPRAAVWWQPVRTTTVRVNAGTGFRTVNLFTEDHAVYTGGRVLVIEEDIRPERSMSATVSLRQIIGAHAPVTVDATAFWTRFSNKIEPDYSLSGIIRYANLTGYAISRGVSIQAQGLIGRRLRYTLNTSLLDVCIIEDGEQRALEYAPDFQGNANVVWEGPYGLELDYTARLAGPMPLPAFAPSVRRAYTAATGAPLYDRSPAHSIHNLQIARKIRVREQLLHLYAAVLNALGYVQSSPVIGFYDGQPGFGPTFDTTYVYGPIEDLTMHYGNANPCHYRHYFFSLAYALSDLEFSVRGTTVMRSPETAQRRWLIPPSFGVA